MKKLFFVVLAFISGTFMFAQSADVVTQIIQSDQVTYGQVCYMSAVHQGLVTESASFAQSINALYDNQQISQVYDEDAIPSLDVISSIVLKMWPEEKDSFMFIITGGSPRYSYKLLKSKGVVRSGFDPKQKISGRDFLNLLTTAMLTFAPEEEGMTMEVNE